MLFCLLLLTGLTMTPDTSETAALPHYPAPIDTVRVDGWATAYYDSGNEGAARGETVLFVHGLGSNLSFWNENLDAFEQAGYRVLALDLPGYGLSEKSDVPATMPFFARTVASFLDALSVEKVHYVGLSMGGQVGLTFALEHPERLRRLVLASPAGIETFSEQEAAAMKAATTAEAIQHESKERIRQNIALNFAEYDAGKYGWIAEQRFAMMERPDFAGYAEANADAVAGMLDGPVRERLGDVRALTLVLFGAGDKLIPNRYLHPAATTAAIARQVGEALPDAEVRMVDDAGHLLVMEQAEAFNCAALAFLEEGD
jgi:pimeloyl-ACP methyl ester carboxylesterase